MATIYDLIEVTGISANTTYSNANGGILGVVEAMTSTALNDGEFDIGDQVTLGGVNYTVSIIREPSSTGSFLLGDGSSRTFTSGFESNLDVMFLGLSDGSTTRYFVLPNDSYGDMNVQAINIANTTAVGGSDAAVIGTADDAVNIVCFCQGTMIDCGGPVRRAVDCLRMGQKVRTVDHGLQPIRWIASSRIEAEVLRRHPRLRAIRIRAGALGPGQPDADLLVSPQHRILVRSRIADRMFGVGEVLVPARYLLPLDMVETVQEDAAVTYYHILFDRHEIILANGAMAESLYIGPPGCRDLPEDWGKAVLRLHGDADGAGWIPQTARTFAAGRRGRHLIDRHVRNGKMLLAGMG